MAAKIDWHRYGTKLRHCLSMHKGSRAVRASVLLSTARCCTGPGSSSPPVSAMRSVTWQAQPTRQPHFRSNTPLLVVFYFRPVSHVMSVSNFRPKFSFRFVSYFLSVFHALCPTSGLSPTSGLRPTSGRNPISGLMLFPLRVQLLVQVPLPVRVSFPIWIRLRVLVSFPV